MGKVMKLPEARELSVGPDSLTPTRLLSVFANGQVGRCRCNKHASGTWNVQNATWTDSDFLNLVCVAA